MESFSAACPGGAGGTAAAPTGGACATSSGSSGAVSNMLGRDGAWYYGRPSGPIHRIMRKSGRMRLKEDTRRAVQEATQGPVSAAHPRHVQGAPG